MADTTNFPTSVTAKAAAANRSRFLSSDSGGGTPGDPASLADLIAYSGTLAPGTYDRAAVLALMGGGATRVLDWRLTVLGGTVDFAQGGTITGLTEGATIVRSYIEGAAEGDFTITVGVEGSATLEARGV